VKHHPIILVHRRSAIAECTCGWIMRGITPTGLATAAQAASVAWARHLEAVRHAG